MGKTQTENGNQGILTKAQRQAYHDIASAMSTTWTTPALEVPSATKDPDPKRNQKSDVEV